MSPGRRFTVAVCILVALSALGTAGYVAIAGMSPLDALYMTIITITTVGYGETVPLGPAGRVFTIVLIVTSVGTTLYLFTLVAKLVVEGQLRDFVGRTAMQHRIDQLEGDIIVCGFGRFGRVVAEELVRSVAQVVIIDRDAAKEPALRALGAPYLIASATSEEVLERAGIRRARAIVVATGSDPENVFITLSAREKNPEIRIHARGESEAGLRRLRLAGADQVLSAYQSGGLRMAASILRPSVVDILELSMPGRGEDVALEEIRVGSGCALAGETIGSVEREIPRLRIVALKRGEESMRIVPEPTLRAEPGDLLLAIGERRSLEQLAQRAQGG